MFASISTDYEFGGATEKPEGACARGARDSGRPGLPCGCTWGGTRERETHTHFKVSGFIALKHLKIPNTDLPGSLGPGDAFFFFFFFFFTATHKVHLKTYSVSEMWFRFNSCGRCNYADVYYVRKRGKKNHPPCRHEVINNEINPYILAPWSEHIFPSGKNNIIRCFSLMGNTASV